METVLQGRPTITDNYKRCDFILLCFSDNSVQEQPMRELVRKYIRCSSRLTIAQVKKFLKVKLDLRTADQVSESLDVSKRQHFSILKSSFLSRLK